MEKWVPIGDAADAIVNKLREQMSKDWADEFVDWMVAEGNMITNPELVAMRLRSIGYERETYATKEAYEQIRRAFSKAPMDLERKQAIENAPFVGGGDK